MRDALKVLQVYWNFYEQLTVGADVMIRDLHRAKSD